jgi:hypothetical protein
MFFDGTSDGCDMFARRCLHHDDAGAEKPISDYELTEAAIGGHQHATCGVCGVKDDSIARIRGPVGHTFDIMTRCDQHWRDPPRQAVVDQQLH